MLQQPFRCKLVPEISQDTGQVEEIAKGVK